MLISVIIPVYNGMRFLQSCMESVLKQTYNNIEVILINDGSTDDTQKLCEFYENNYDCVKAFQQDNSGVSTARNYGLDLAQGDYIYFCDCDDILHPEILENLLRNMQNTGAEISCCSYKNFTDILEWDKTGNSSTKVVCETDMIRMILNNTSCLGYVWNKLFKREYIEKDIPLRFQENIVILEDEVFVLEYISRVHSMCISNEALYGYRSNENGAMQMEFNEGKLTSILGRERILDICKNQKCEKDILIIVWNRLMQGYVYAYKNIMCHSCKQKKYWRDLIKEKFLKYRDMPYQVDNTWKWTQKITYYWMKHFL